MPVFEGCFASSALAFFVPMLTCCTPAVAFLIVTGRVPTYLPESSRETRDDVQSVRDNRGKVHLPSESCRKGLTIHFFPSLQEIFGIRITHEPESSPFVRVLVTDDFALDERREPRTTERCRESVI